MRKAKPSLIVFIRVDGKNHGFVFKSKEEQQSFVKDLEKKGITDYCFSLENNNR